MKVFGCRICDYDVCQKCHKQKSINKNDQKSKEKANLFKPIIFELFQNLNNITIISTFFRLNNIILEHKIDLFSLLNVIEESHPMIINNTKIIIKAAHKYKTHKNKSDRLEYIGDSWIGMLCKQSWNAIKSEYNAKQYKISLINTESIWNSSTFKEDWLVIETKS